MDELSYAADAVDEANDDVAVDWATSPGAFRRAHQTLKARLDVALAQLADQRALRLQIAALKAGLDPDQPGVGALLESYEGEVAPGAVYAYVLDATATLLAGARAGRSWTEFADVMEPRS